MIGYRSQDSKQSESMTMRSRWIGVIL